MFMAYTPPNPTPPPPRSTVVDTLQCGPLRVYADMVFMLLLRPVSCSPFARTAERVKSQRGLRLTNRFLADDERLRQDL